MIGIHTPVVMTKGYKGEKGKIVDVTDSPYGLYIVLLEKNLRIVAGVSAFSVERNGLFEHPSE
jgi:hypothetical protein